MAELPLSFIHELKALRFDDQAETLVTGYAQRHLKQMESLAGNAYMDGGHDFPICRLHPLGRLAVLVWKLAEIRVKYLAPGIAEEIISDAFGDISLRQRLFYETTGKVGLSRADCVWLRHLMNAQIFKLGVLQYQPTNMFYLETYQNGKPFFVISKAQKARLPAGTPVLNVHIQTGADLAEEKVAESLQVAKAFFHQVYPDTHFKAMICYSWLLHSGLQDLLPRNSRILHFARNFDVISETGDKRQAVERIFGKPFGSKHLPQKTSLQQAALRDMSKLGYSLGVIYLD